MSWSEISGSAKLAGLFAVLGFVLAVESISSSSSNGVVTACSYTNYGALVFGALAVFVGGTAAINALATKNQPSLIVSAIAALVGIFHVVSGLGLIGSPCG